MCVSENGRLPVQDLLNAVRGLMAGAAGELGLCVTCSLDAGARLVLAARGRPMSVAIYPRLGMVLWGSEQVRARTFIIIINFILDKAQFDLLQGIPWT